MSRIFEQNLTLNVYKRIMRKSNFNIKKKAAIK